MSYSVTEFNNIIKNILFSNINDKIELNGEISNLKTSSGNTYLTLKDDQSCIQVVLWKIGSEGLSNGDKVIVVGKIGFYLGRGYYQINGSSIKKIGTGLLFEEYEKLKKKFEKKGYFFKSTQRVNLPTKINSIGILTASNGAALQDILYVLNSNKFDGKVYIKNCAVQGNNCSKSIVDGIKYFNTFKDDNIDIILITRGGGSIEDLIGFSTKDVVKSIYKTKIYTISAVGHEIDNMLSDYAANYRAPTPSVAAEVISSINKKKYDSINSVKTKLMELHNIIKFKINTMENKNHSYKKIFEIMHPENIINSNLDKLGIIKNNFKMSIVNNINLYSDKINKLYYQNDKFNNSIHLNNGYSMITDEHNNIISTCDDFIKTIKNNKNKKLNILFKDGTVNLYDLLSTISGKKTN